jgi:hypothetical protein
MSAPMEIFESQNKKDDDGPVIDSFFIETDAPPDLKQAPISAEQPKLDVPKPITRLLTGNTLLDNTFTVQQILPADANRKSVTLSIFSNAANPVIASEYVSVADENGKVLTSSAYILRHGKDPLTLDGHTGPIYAVSGPGVLPAARIELSWIAITS